MNSPGLAFVGITPTAFGLYMDNKKRPSKKPHVFCKLNALAEQAIRGKAKQKPELMHYPGFS